MPNLDMKTWKLDWDKQREPIGEEVEAASIVIYEALEANLFALAVQVSPAAAIQAAVSSALHFARYNMRDSGLKLVQGDAAASVVRRART